MGMWRFGPNPCSGWACCCWLWACFGPSLSPLPAPKPANQLIVTGSYAICRHPLYRAVVLCSAGVVLATGSPLHLLLLVSLAAVLRGKARFEEQGLRALHPDYSQYA